MVETAKHLAGVHGDQFAGGGKPKTPGKPFEQLFASVSSISLIARLMAEGATFNARAARRTDPSLAT